MDATALRATQAPLKARYKEDPVSAVVTLDGAGVIHQETIACAVKTHAVVVEAGLHPATGGDGTFACSGDMLLQSLAACAGVTLASVATAMGIVIRGGVVRAEGELDFRGTLGVAKDAPVGFRAIRLSFDLDTDAGPDQVAKLISLTERYCVVYQTLKAAPPISVAAC